MNLCHMQHYMSMYVESKTLKEYVNYESNVYYYESMSMYVKSKIPNGFVNYECV